MSKNKIATATARSKRAQTDMDEQEQISLYLSSRHRDHADTPHSAASVDQYRAVFATLDAAMIAATKGAQSGDGYLGAVKLALVAVAHSMRSAKDETSFILLCSEMIGSQARAYMHGYVGRTIARERSAKKKAA